MANTKEFNSERLGGLWKASSKKNPALKYLKGVLDINGEKVSVVVFPVKEKREENSPDYDVIRSQPMERPAGGGYNKAPVRTVAKTVVPAVVSKPADGEEFL